MSIIIKLLFLLNTEFSGHTLYFSKKDNNQNLHDNGYRGEISYSLKKHNTLPGVQNIRKKNQIYND